jgi:amino acid adenylation domain-containing protein
MNSVFHPPTSAAESRFPLSFAQERMWFLYRLAPANASYHVGMALRCTGMLDVEGFHWALSAVVRRHDVLRTVFGEHEGIPYQRVDDGFDLDFEIIDAAREKLLDLCLAAAIKPFCLESAPGIRAVLLRLSDHDHVLQITLHHIISDAWSMNVLLVETAQLYEAFLSGSMRALPPLQVQYWQFAAEERAALLKSEMESDLAYWRKQLEGMAPTQLPADRTPPSGQANLGAKLSVALHSELFGKIQELSRKEGLTLFMVLVAGLQVVLGRWMAQEDITVGTAVANRKSAELEALIGLFVNTLVIRTSLSGNPTVRELCKRVRHVCLGAYAHQDLPFDSLVIELNPERSLERNPLFQTMFTLQNAPAPHVHLSRLRLEPMVLDWGASAFDMALSVWEGKGRLEGWLEYSTELFETQTVQRFLDHWQHALEEMAAAPGKEISSVHLLSPKERQQILDWNATAQANQLDHGVHELFEQNAQRSPEALAVVHGEDELTYHELNERSNQLAHYLIRLNLGPEKLIGIFLPRSTEIIVAMLATLKAGAAYIPLDPQYPSERIRFMLDNARASMVLTHAVLAERLGWQKELTLSLDHHQQAIAKESAANPRNKLSALNLAYVIYTSGSTGQPKGVQISHASLLNLVQWHLQAFDVTSTDVASQMASLGFDAAVWEIWPCLVAGAKLCLIDDHVRLSPAALRDMILARNITISFMPTPVAESVLALDWPQKTSLKTLLAGGDKLHRCGSRQFPFAVVNNYGPTECTVVATSMTVDHGKEMDPPIGHPIRNAKSYVVDREMELVPARVAGELYIGGTGLARSYVNYPEMTAEKFVPDPLSQEPGARLYRTGDLARWRLDGTLEFLGRADEQVKIRGFRIELGEIEAALLEHGGVRQAVVIVLEDETGDKRLVAYVVPELQDEKIDNGSRKAELRISELREHLLGKLPQYMMPSSYVQLEELPLNHNGKIDRKNLPQPDTDTPEQEYVGPGSATEEALCRLWQEVLRRKHVGIHDNFFKIGGHSLLGARVAARMRESFKVDIPLRRIFESPTVAQLAEAIDQITQSIGADSTDGASSPGRPAIKRVARRAALVDVD